VTTAVTWLIRGFVYGFVAYGPALVAAVLAIVVTWVLALYVGGRRVSQNA
jgi:hypothetical protein